MELLLYNIYVIGYKYKSIREEEENNTYNLSAWENRKENIMADKKAIIDETQFEAQYDAEAKLLLAQKPFLANILVRTVKDYMGLNPCDARIVITHGGPASFIMPLQVGKVPIVVPRQHKFDEHVNDHQVEFARNVAERMGTIIPVEDIGKLEEIIMDYDQIATGMGHGMSGNNEKFCSELEDIIHYIL